MSEGFLDQRASRDAFLALRLQAAALHDPLQSLDVTLALAHVLLERASQVSVLNLTSQVRPGVEHLLFGVEDLLELLFVQVLE